MFAIYDFWARKYNEWKHYLRGELQLDIWARCIITDVLSNTLLLSAWLRPKSISTTSPSTATIFSWKPALISFSLPNTYKWSIIKVSGFMYLRSDKQKHSFQWSGLIFCQILTAQSPWAFKMCWNIIGVWRLINHWANVHLEIYWPQLATYMCFCPNFHLFRVNMWADNTEQSQKVNPMMP